MKRISIYRITNLINGKIYVGQKLNDTPDYLGSGKLIKNAVNKNGKENFKKEILEECFSREQANEIETFWIQELKAYDREIGYNISKTNFGGDTFTNNPNKEEMRKNRSLISSGKNNPRYGDHRSLEELCGKEKADKLKMDKSILMESMDRSGWNYPCGEDNYFYGIDHSGINNPRYKEVEKDIENAIIEAYSEGYFPYEIQEIYKLGIGKILSILKEKGIPLRNVKQSQELRHKRQMNNSSYGSVLEKYECKYCHKIVSGLGNLKRWHNDNCKNREEPKCFR